MSSRSHWFAGAAFFSFVLVTASPVSAQLFGGPAPRQQDYGQQSGDDDADQGLQIERLQNQLRKLTGQNEELQFRNRQLEEQLRQVQAGAPPAGAPAAGARPNVAAAPVQVAPARQQPVQPQVYDPQPPVAAAAPIVQDPAPPARGGRRNDAFDPNANPNAPGAPRALGGGGQPIPATAPAAMPNSRGAGEPLPLGNAAPASSGGLTTLPPGSTPKDEFDLGIGYMQRRDYALAEETMRNFAQKYPTDPQLADSQYWLGESFFQRQKYRDAAEAFLGVTTKFDTSAKAPDALLRLGQSLAALKEKEAACAAFGEVLRKYPRASSSVKTAVDREQTRVKC